MKVNLVELWYPKSSDDSCAQIVLMHTRAARDLRVCFDFERDGWVISTVDSDDYESEPVWVEKAFVHSWNENE